MRGPFQLLPGERPLALATLGLSGGAAAIALAFAVREKAHVVLHTAMAYVGLWSLLIIYAVGHRRRARLLCTLVWLTALVFGTVVSLFHLDDIPARMIYRESAAFGPGMTQRSAAPWLYVAVVLNGLWMVLMTLHAVWLGWRKPTASSEMATGQAEP